MGTLVYNPEWESFARVLSAVPSDRFETSGEIRKRVTQNRSIGVTIGDIPLPHGYAWSDAIGWYWAGGCCSCCPKPVGLGWEISEQTKRELKEIDDNIRSANINAKNIVCD
jgi:hypothetical protein